MKSDHTKFLALIFASAILVTVVLGKSKFLGVSVPNASAVTAEPGLGVYWAANCRRSSAVSTIDWGMLLPGQVRDVVVYVRNEADETFVLALTPLNWNPANASRYLSVALSCEDRKIEAGQVAEVTLSLSVSPVITGDYDFRFDLVFEGKEFFLGDINRDGSVNILDVGLLSAAMRSTPTSSGWNPKADLNRDGIIDIFDLSLLSSDFGKSW